MVRIAATLEQMKTFQERFPLNSRVVMGADGTPLSKRHGSTSVRDFRERGFLPEAVLNHLFHLGHKRPRVPARPLGACLGQDEHGELGQPVTGEYIDVAPLHHFPGRAQAISIKP